MSMTIGQFRALGSMIDVLYAISLITLDEGIDANDMMGHIASVERR